MQHILFSLASAIIGINFLLFSGYTDTEVPSFEQYDVEAIVAVDATPMPYTDFVYEKGAATVSHTNDGEEISTVITEIPTIERSVSITITQIPTITATPTQVPEVTPTCSENCEGTPTPTPTVSVTISPTITPSPTTTPGITFFEANQIPSPTPYGNSCIHANPTPHVVKPPYEELHMAVCL